MKNQKIFVVFAVVCCLQTALFAQKFAVAPIIGIDVPRMITVKTPSGQTVADISPPISFTAGAQTRFQFSEKFSVQLLSEAAYGMFKILNIQFRSVDVHLEPQFEYRPFKYCSIYCGLQNRINANEWIKDGDNWTGLSQRHLQNANSDVVDVRFFAPYELRGKIGLRGYSGNTFLDLSYFHGLTKPFGNIAYTDESGNFIAYENNYASGLRMAVGYFFNVGKKAGA